MNRAARVVLCLCSFLPAAAQKQTGGKASSVAGYKLIALKVAGTARYNDKEILAASGLQIGQYAADGDFKEAVQRLGKAGVFSDVSYSYTSSGTGTRLELQLADIDKSKLVPALFDNFVWFTDDELRAALQSHVPLFKDALPIGGNLSDRVSEALQAMLSEKRLPGRVNYVRQGPASDDAPTAIDYRVEEVTIRIRNVEFPGASPEQSALLTKAARRLAGAEYDRASLAAVAKIDLLPTYLQRGYLRAKFGPSDARVLPQPAAEADVQNYSELQVDAILPVTPGKIYSTSSVDWKGNHAIPSAELAAVVHLPPGQPADALTLLRDIENASKLYHSRGYMMVEIKPDPQFDEEKSTVHYEINVAEGDLYRMGELDIVGLDTQAKARIQAAWALREGQPYNADYLKKFLADTRPLLPPRVSWGVTVHETPDEKDKTVDIEIRFRQE